MEMEELQATIRESTEANRMMMQHMAAQDEERAVWAARTGAETVKTEHDKIPGLQAESDEDEESDDEDGPLPLPG